MRGADDPGRDLAAVGDQQLGDGRLLAGHGTSRHIRKTPKPRRPAHGLPWTADSDDAEHGPGVARVDDAVVVEPGGDEEGVRLGLDLGLDRGGAGPVRLLVERLPGGRGRRPADDRQHPGELRRAHHRELRARPGEHQPRVVGPPGHAVVARAERGRHVDRQVRDRQLVTALIIFAPSLMMPPCS